MKVESAYGNEVYVEDWNTPVMHSDQLWLLAELRILNDVHFFFKLNSDSPDDIYVITVSSFCPLRITDEAYAYTCIGKYVDRKVPREKNEKTSSTYKLWNTSFIKDVDENHALSNYAPERNKNIFQYLIVTQNEWIEFISLDPIEWRLHKNIKEDELVCFYLKKSLE
ncbi:MAG: hypothetical protein A2381_00220 [Bdellovibrionales bacterium RIFOXYB1_FULL_37_110]|nr:MAG: hypothetical protein A2417_11275 [Bdellovibrionales bacterium RIFOXYC1_FULL_37_79]OFZ60819.1 MAG: hypothetical protein A2381_00220 [Bdellovibrionales bacterium RIFOXYB1_FULL_37_110]OFZ62349.1 MAG: hypothetical protein A2577_02885 [Bdellovibrionales bacterium RIFOXYD1_FULL_36_51]